MLEGTTFVVIFIPFSANRELGHICIWGTRWVDDAAHFEMFDNELRVPVTWEEPILSPIPLGLTNLLFQMGLVTGPV